MVTHFCDIIKTFKVTRLDTRPDEFAFDVALDQCSIPINPIALHPVEASLCRTRERGVPMKLGISSTNGKKFDPLIHIDLIICNVTVIFTTTYGQTIIIQSPNILSIIHLSELNHQ
jgi:hypothetical protein